jgi:hypothetical protein
MVGERSGLFVSGLVERLGGRLVLLLCGGRHERGNAIGVRSAWEQLLTFLYKRVKYQSCDALDSLMVKSEKWGGMPT